MSLDLTNFTPSFYVRERPYHLDGCKTSVRLIPNYAGATLVKNILIIILIPLLMSRLSSILKMLGDEWL